MANTTRDFITSNMAEGVKQHFAYDASNRLEYTYEAPTSWGDGKPCLRTQYTYDGTSSRITGMAETLSIWQATWDL